MTTNSESKIFKLGELEYKSRVLGVGMFIKFQQRQKQAILVSPIYIPYEELKRQLEQDLTPEEIREKKVEGTTFTKAAYDKIMAEMYQENNPYDYTLTALEAFLTPVGKYSVADGFDTATSSQIKEALSFFSEAGKSSGVLAQDLGNSGNPTSETPEVEASKNTFQTNTANSTNSLPSQTERELSVST